MANVSTVAAGIELHKGARTESFRIRFMYRGRSCAETLKLPHTKVNINFAIRLRGEIQNAIEKGTFDYAAYFPDSAYAKAKIGTRKSTLLGDLLAEQIRIAEKSLSPSTAAGYKRVCKAHLSRKWGSVAVQDVTPADLREWIGTLDCKLKTLRNILTPLSLAFKQAVNDELIAFNPLDRIELDRLVSRESKQSDFEVDPFSAEEIDAILRVMQGQERNFFQFAFATGMRTSELIALRWSDIDWLKLRIRVCRACVNGKIKETKTKAGTRFIDMRLGAYEALMAQKAHTFLAGELVFHDPGYDDARRWEGDYRVRTRWNVVMRKAGVRYRNPYQTRHTYASTLLSAGENLLYVARQMGHKTTEMVVRTYGRWVEQGAEEPVTMKDFFVKVSSEFLAQRATS